MKSRLSFPGNSHPGITFHAGGNFDFQNLFFMQDTLAAAFFAFVFNYPTAAFAIRAGLFNNKKAALAHLHFAMAVASRAYRRFFAVCRTETAAVFANNRRRDGNLFFDAAESFFQRDFQIIADIRPVPGIRPTAAALLTAAHKFGKNIRENIGETAAAEIKLKAAERIAAAHAGGKSLMPVPVISRTFLLVFQNIISFINFLEFGFSFLIARVPVRMIFHGQAAI